MLLENKPYLNFRAGGVCIDKGRVLVHRANQDNFWTLPGGRCEPGETSIEALEREILEVLNVEIKALTEPGRAKPSP